MKAAREYILHPLTFPQLRSEKVLEGFGSEMQRSNLLGACTKKVAEKAAKALWAYIWVYTFKLWRRILRDLPNWYPTH